MNDCISVIVPVYKVEKYLKRCIDSIISQTYKNLEIILVDDGSPDNCGKICDEYAKKDDRIKVIHQTNSGLSMARNAGLDIAQGEFIGFVDSDDYIHPQMYEIFYRSITKNNADMVFSNYKQSEIDYFEHNLIKEYNEKIYEKTDIVDMCCTDKSRIMVAWNKLYRKRIFNEIRYTPEVACEDAYILIDILGECQKISYIDEELYYYSIEREDSIMREKYNFKMLKDELKAYKKMIDFFEDNSISNLYIDYNWVYFKYITKIREHYYKIKKHFSNRKDVLYKLSSEYLQRYNLYGRNIIKNKKIRNKQDKFYLECKIKRIMYLNNDFKRIYKDYLRKKLIKRIKHIKGKKIFLIGTPEYGNLGDHAIAISTKKFLNDRLNDFKVIEITSGDYHYGKKTVKPAIKEVISKDDIILISGGGFLGSLWVNHCGEEMVRDVLTSFSENKIIILPQTIFFEDNLYGKEQFLISKKVYEAHKHLVVCVRENKSFEFMKNNMPNVNIELIPDMVFYLKEKNIAKRRSGAILCLRNDKEKVYEINIDISEKYDKVIKLNTVVNKCISINKREKLVKSMLNKFRKSEFVCTDRLHGMLFAYITNTPFEAFDNISGKIKSTFNTWISNEIDEISLREYNVTRDIMGDFEKLKYIINKGD